MLSSMSSKRSPAPARIQATFCAVAAAVRSNRSSEIVPFGRARGSADSQCCRGRGGSRQSHQGSELVTERLRDEVVAEQQNGVPEALGPPGRVRQLGAGPNGLAGNAEPKRSLHCRLPAACSSTTSCFRFGGVEAGGFRTGHVGARRGRASTIVPCQSRMSRCPLWPGTSLH
jgi:hypothetical protein